MGKSKSKTSKWRHIFAEDVKNEQVYTDLPKPFTSGESQYCCASHKFFAVAKDGAGGPVVVRKIGNYGRITTKAPLLNTHDGKVLDLAFAPYNANLLATVSEDMHIHLHNLPKGGLKETIKTPFSKMGGTKNDHQKKIGAVKWNRVADNILATGSYDRTVKVYDVSTCQNTRTFKKLDDNIYSMEWNTDGSRMAVCSKSKKATVVSVFDPRAEDVVKFKAFGKKTGKIFWAENHGFIGGVGYTFDAKRILKLWDLKKLGPEPAYEWEIDNAASVYMPTYDEDMSLLWMYGKGDSSVLLTEISKAKGYQVLGAHRLAGDPSKGGCWMPRRGLSVLTCEAARFFRLTKASVIPHRFIVPRKSQLYQPDIYPKTYSGRDRISADDWDAGKNGVVKLMSLDPDDGENVDDDVEIVKKLTYKELQAENEKLKARVAELEEKLGIKPEEEKEDKEKEEKDE